MTFIVYSSLFMVTGGVPSRFFDDPKEAEEAMGLAKAVLVLVEKKTMEMEGQI